ncbi:MAG: hypothetical protein JXB36_13560, partial [Gammaproteobacteria bacterium]|nr:hypothetical protein [Gammaproteobacteria bacterium]
MTRSASSSRSILTTNGLVIGALLIGFANHVAIAALFGLTRNVDAYYAALMLPTLFMNLFLDYLGKNFMPTFARARKESRELASELTSSVVTIVSLVAVGAAVLLALFGAKLFELLLPGFTAGEVELVHRYFLIMAPTLVLTAITVFHEYACQHDEDYVRIAAIRAALPVANLIAILALSPLIREYALPTGYLLGHVIVFVLMARRANYTYSCRISLRRDWERKIFANSAVVMGSGLVARTKVIVMNYLGSMLGGGAISA